MDSSIYGALVRLAQPWVMRYPLIDFHGNVGNQDGDPPAHQRYSEARLASITEDGMLMGIKKNNVDFIDNYSETSLEPVELPAVFPNLLCNPNTGIGVALASNWPSNNLREVAQAIYDYLDGKEPMLPGPDFSTGGVIINKNDIPAIMRTGRGTVKIRGKYTIEKNKIIFTEIPYGINTEDLMKQIGEACDKEEITGIDDIRNESSKKGFRLVLECEKNANIDSILSKLFAKTDLQSSFSYNQVALVDKTPTELNLKDCIKIYVDYNSKCLKREAQFDIQKAESRIHIIDGLLKALADIDDIIATIKSAESSVDAKEKLKQNWSFSEEQAKAILDMRLAKLAKLEKKELENEKQDLLIQLISLKEIYNNPIPELIKRLSNLVDKYGDDRRTELIQLDAPSKSEKVVEEIEPEKCVVVLTEAGNIKRIPASSYRTQSRNGKGVKTQDDITHAIIRTNTVDALMIFSDRGKVYRISVNDIPVGTNTSKGQNVRSLVKMEPNEKPAQIYSVYKDTTAKYVAFATKNGLVKKTPLEEYSSLKKFGGFDAITLREGDALASVALISDEDLICLTKQGHGVRFKSSEVPATGRKGFGVKGVSLSEGDEVVAMIPLRDASDNLAIFSTLGLGKKISMSELPAQGRGGKGLYVYKPTSTSGEPCAMALISDKDQLLLVGNMNSICVNAKDIPLTGRTAVGNQIIQTKNLITVSKI